MGVHVGVPSICPEKPLWSLIPRVFGPCPWDSFGHRKFGTRHELKELAWNARGRRTWLSDQQRLSDLNERLSDLRIPNWDRLVRVLTHLCWLFQFLPFSVVGLAPPSPEAHAARGASGVQGRRARGLSGRVMLFAPLLPCTELLKTVRMLCHVVSNPQSNNRFRGLD